MTETSVKQGRISLPPDEVDTADNENKLFVYGIFLDQSDRDAYGMTNPQYATVKDYLTVGSYIVQATHVPGIGLALTGLLVDMNPAGWQELDMLEGAYDRVRVSTTMGKRAWMYVAKQ